LRTRVGPGNNVLDGGPDGDFEVEKRASYCKVQGHSAVICTKTAEPVEMPFGLWARIGPVNHVLDAGSEFRSPWEGAILGNGLPIVKYREFLP